MAEVQAENVEEDGYDDDFEEHESICSNNENKIVEREENGSSLLCESVDNTERSLSLANSRSKSKKSKKRYFVHLPATTSVSGQPVASRVIDAKMWEQRRAQDAERIANIKSTLIAARSPPKPIPVSWR
jgi:hypothetical protein